MVSLIFCGDLKYCPYIWRYIERFEANEIEYEVVFWNRSDDRVNFPSNYKYYDVGSDLGQNRLYKFFDFFCYRNWLLDYLNNTESDRFVLLSTLTGVMIGRELVKRKVKYIFDIRDYSYEHILPYYVIEKYVISHSFKTVISSAGFKKFLPENYDYVLAHNFNRNDIDKSKDYHRSYSYKKIRIVWNGVIRYFDYQSDIIRALANDDRFEMIYHGDGPELNSFKDFCRSNGIGNVFFTGAYDNKDKMKLLENATIINNCYGYKKGAGNKLKYAISNKFYDGLIYHIPQFVEENGFKADLVKQYGVGIALNLKRDIGEQIIEYLNSIDFLKFVNNCNTLLRKVIEEDNCYVQLIDSFSRI